MNVQIKGYSGSTYESVNPNANNADTLDGYHAQYFLNEISSLKTSVSNGKSAIAGAITDKRISTSSSDSFQTMANNISKIGVNSISDFLNQDVFVIQRQDSSLDALAYIKSAFSSTKIIIAQNNWFGATSDANLGISLYQFDITLNDLMENNIVSIYNVTTITSYDYYNYNQRVFVFYQMYSTSIRIRAGCEKRGNSYLCRIASSDINNDRQGSSIYFLLQN